MNYKNIYESIIKNRQQYPASGYTERHHIVPKSLGGGDEETNLVELTAREHFICHLLLTKMVKKNSPDYHKMLAAFLMMLYCHGENQKRHVTNRSYEQLRIIHADYMSTKQTSEGNNRFGYMWIFNEQLKESKTVLKSTILENGWKKGRVLNWDRHLDPDLERKRRKDREAQERSLRIQQKEKDRVRVANEYYEIYVKHGFEQFVALTGYKFKLWALLDSFRKYVPHYTPYAVKSFKE